MDISVVERLNAEQIHAVEALIDHATEVDGTTPLDEHATLHLRHGGDDEVHHVLVTDPEIVGYLHLDVTDALAGSSAQLVVAPGARRRGIGRLLVERAAELSPDGRLRLWSRGRGTGAGELARTLGFTTVRVLLQMRGSLLEPLAGPSFAPGVRLRSFVPGVDDEAWLELNAKAFAHHPDQGRWTLDDLRIRMSESWFDPTGFLLAVDEDDALLGFHWTKVHGGSHSHAAPEQPEEPDRPELVVHAHDEIGEVYVVGIDPAAQGHGLGRALTLAGLHYLRGRGLTEAMLYVDESNTSAVRLYESLGFTTWDLDVQYAREAVTAHTAS